MNLNPAWRGNQHLRVWLDVTTTRIAVSALVVIDTPTVQPPLRGEAWLAHVRVEGATALIQPLGNPLAWRGIGQGDRGHVHVEQRRADVIVHVPLDAPRDVSDVEIRVVNLSSSRRRPLDLAAMEEVLGKRIGKTVGRVTTGVLAAHPDWPNVARRLGLPDARFEVYLDARKQYRWRFVGPGGDILADSGGGYPTRDALVADLRVVRRGASKARFELHTDRAQEWRWRIRSSAGGIVADSGEGYPTRTGLNNDVKLLRTAAPDAPIVDLRRS